jgi:putative flippase GtrA
MTPFNNISQFLKFSFVGVLNTLITLLTIWVFVNVFSTSHYVANVMGYVLGVLNSFIMNKIWTFNHKSKTGATFIKFIGVFVITYLIQFSVLSLLLNFSKLDPFVSQILAMITYTILNFIINKKFTFKSNI